ncbi:hypothetical protein [Novosphingobium mathurense]|uniref:hypothetical protein n=1 Tax=Novosphingobium mathurense TaxID=428990 RepID=UPI0009A82412|nr:hypothetical protein [Novosphingobium mathurense]
MDYSLNQQLAPRWSKMVAFALAFHGLNLRAVSNHLSITDLTSTYIGFMAQMATTTVGGASTAAVTPTWNRTAPYYFGETVLLFDELSAMENSKAILQRKMANRTIFSDPYSMALHQTWYFSNASISEKWCIYYAHHMTHNDALKSSRAASQIVNAIAEGRERAPG